MLANKVSQLERDVITADRIASFWRKQIDLYGEDKAEAFYRSLGLNHLDSPKEVQHIVTIRAADVHSCTVRNLQGLKGSIQWEGLTLSRQPTEIEKLCVKGIAQAQEAGKESVTSILLKVRSQLIDSALSKIKKLKPATYHELTLSVPAELHSELRDELEQIFMRGKALVNRELGGSKAIKQSDLDEEEDDELDDLAGITDGRMANETQARIASAAIRLAALGLTGKALWDAVMKEVAGSSTAWVQRIATGASNNVLNFGRYQAMRDRADDIDRYEQSEILDQNTCGPCAADDGKTASNPDDLPGAPNPDCEGGDYCRGFIIAIAL